MVIQDGLVTVNGKNDTLKKKTDFTQDTNMSPNVGQIILLIISFR